ncbi:hypothetical protein LIER_03703 [Lithospermum erythrorhizon]|uniref:Protein FAR1-RELATED SEQUENCE n=1 Tax=Lithospermum erythrorhizon TaxID=34254 RepID=A0AAV3NUV6_LITER
MENQVIQFDINLSCGRIIDDAQFRNYDHVDIDVDGADEDTIRWPAARDTGDNCFPDGELDLEPYEGMEFETEEAAKAFYNSYARRVGFSTRVNYSRRGRKDGAIIKRLIITSWCPPDQVHCLRSHRQISGPAKTLIDTLQAAGMGPRRIMSALIKEYGCISKVGFTEVDCKNYMRNNRKKESRRHSTPLGLFEANAGK